MNLPAIPQKKQEQSGFSKMLSLGMIGAAPFMGPAGIPMAMSGLSGIANKGVPDMSLAAQGLKTIRQSGGGWQNSLRQGMYTHPEDSRFRLMY